jgi:hypothetical protein
MIQHGCRRGAHGARLARNASGSRAEGYCARPDGSTSAAAFCTIAFGAP